MAKRDTEVFNTKTGKWITRADAAKTSKDLQKSDKKRSKPKDKDKPVVTVKEDQRIIKMLNDQLNRSSDPKEEKRLKARLKALKAMGRGE